MGAAFELSGRTALVTGASGSLGGHFARTLASAGARVVLAARRLERLQAIAEEITSDAGEAMAVECDVTDADSVGEAFRRVDAAWGPVTVLINNSGVTGTRAAVDVEEQDWDRILDTNLKGAWLMARQCARLLIEQDTDGSIVNIGSVLGSRVAGHVTPYAASKAGLTHLTRALALEWARYGIRVNALCPGYIETDLNRDFFASSPGQAMIKRIPQRRLGTPQDLDGALLLLASDASRYMTGSDLVVDGGHLQSTL